MHLTQLQSATTAQGPFTSAHLDVTRTGPPPDNELRLRWAAVRRDLHDQGAPDDAIEAVGERVLSATGRHGEAARSVVAGVEGVLLDRLLPNRPARDCGVYGPVPDLVPIARAIDSSLTYLLVEVDRSGADLSVVDSLAGQLEEHGVEGGHDELHKVAGGGVAQRRYQNRVEDSWERNAEVVARDLTRVVERHRPDLILVTGDQVARSAVREHLGRTVLDLVVSLDGGGRGEGVHRDSLDADIGAALDRHRQMRTGDALARFAEVSGRGAPAASGLADVVTALSAGAVETLVLHAETLAEQQLWAGRQPLHLGTSADAVRALGADDVVPGRADAVLVRALVAQGGEVEFVDVAEMLPGNIGAVLRFDVRGPGSEGG